jgi:FKBP-type peptidyl-prolyl cis-trans isomerase FkpA
MKKLVILSLAGITAFASVSAQTSKPAAKPATKPATKTAAKPATTAALALKTLSDSASYAIGLSEARFLQQQGITKINSAILAKAIDDVMAKKTTAMTDAECNNAIMTYINRIQKEKSKGVIEEGEKFLAENKKKPGVKTTPSGLQYEVLREGTGAKPSIADTFVVHYRGTLIDGTEFDGSYGRGEPLVYPLTAVIPGWTEGIQLMPIGSKYKFYIPYNIGYGLQGNPPTIPGGATLIFEIELLDIKKKM